MDYVTFGLILDDIVFADDRLEPGALGGGGPQTAFGLRLWGGQVGLVAGVGADLPQAAWDWLRLSGVDTAGVRVTDLPTPRARQTLDAAGNRSHVWQVPLETLGWQLSRSPEYLPAAWRAARGFHFGTHPEEPDLQLAAGLRGSGGLVSLELFRPAERPLPPEALRRLLSAPDIFSLNRQEAESLLGPGDPEDLARRLMEQGARVLVLRLDAGGALAGEASRSGRVLHLPAYPVREVNPVGAGNAFCGAFLAGWVQTRDLVEAGLRGAAAASLVVEQPRLPPVTPALRAEAQARVARLRMGAPHP